MKYRWVFDSVYIVHFTCCCFVLWNYGSSVDFQTIFVLLWMEQSQTLTHQFEWYFLFIFFLFCCAFFIYRILINHMNWWWSKRRKITFDYCASDFSFAFKKKSLNFCISIYSFISMPTTYKFVLVNIYVNFFSCLTKKKEIRICHSQSYKWLI